MRPTLISLLLALALTGCSRAESEAQEAVKEALKDPESARFGDFKMYEGPGGQTACLVVNAKNSYGGYTGDQLAVLSKSKDGRWIVADIVDQPFKWCEITAQNMANS